MNAKTLLWIPALWALAFDWYFGPFSFTPAFLVVPIAAFLGQRHGRRALWLVAIGGLGLLPPILTLGMVNKTSALDVYAVALAVCALAADERRVGEEAASRVPRFGTPLLATALVVLPMSMSIWGTQLGGLRIGMVFGFNAIFWLLLFLLGWNGFPARRAVAALVIAAIVGMWLDTVVPRDGSAFFGGPQAELPLFGLTGTQYLWWDYRVDSPAALLNGIAYFAAGRLWAAMLRTRALPLAPGQAWSLVLAVAVLALGSALNRAALIALGLGARELPTYGFLLGAPFALPLAGLLGGLLLARRGIAAAIAVVVLFWVIDAFAMAGFKLPLHGAAAGVHQPLVVLGFGLLGLALRERALGAEAKWQVRRWVIAAVLVGLAVNFVAESDGPVDLALRAGAVVLAAALGALATWLRARLGGWFRFTPEAWGSALVLLLVAALLAGQGAALKPIANQVFTDGFWNDLFRGREDAAYAAATAFGFLGIAVYALETFLRSVPALAGDVASWFRTAKAPAAASSTLWPRLAAWARGVRYAAFALAVLPVLYAVALALYPEDGIVAAVKGLLRGPSEARGSRVAASTDPKTAPNPLLWQAAKEAAAQFPQVEADVAIGRIATGWRTDPAAPDTRTRMTIGVGAALRPSAVVLDLVREKRGRLGIWVQQGTYRDPRTGKLAGTNTAPETERVRSAIFARALEMEKDLPKESGSEPK